MLELESDKLYAQDDTGKEVVFRIILTTEINNKNYVVVEDPNEDVLAFSYDEETQELSAVENDLELELINEVYSAFLEENNEG